MKQSIRDAVTRWADTTLTASWPDIPVAHPNLDFDWSNPPDRFLSLEIDFTRSSQVFINPRPSPRVFGSLYLTAMCPVGSGSRWGTSFQEWAIDSLLAADIPELHLRMPSAVPLGRLGDRWAKFGVRCPGWFDW